MIILATNENFNALIKEEKVLVDFFATWCGPCKMLTPVLEDFDKTNSDVKIVKVDIDKLTHLAEKYGVSSVPTLMIFSKGNIIDTKVGFQSKSMLEDWYNKTK